MSNKRKFIVIGESWLEIAFEGDAVKSSRPAGLMLDLCRELASRGETPTFITEIGLDPIGDNLATSLENDGVDISCADRYAGHTSLMTVVDGVESRYDIPTGCEGFDVKWPRIEKEDVIVFGGYMALDGEIRDRLWSLVSYASERKATIVYILDVNDVRLPQITMVMSRVFENLEIADLVMSVPGDLKKAFKAVDAASAFRNNLSFYCSNAALIEDGADGCDAAFFGDVSKGVGRDVAAVISDILIKLPIKE